MKVVLISWAGTAQHHYCQKSKKSFISFWEAYFLLDCFKTKFYQRREWENLGVNARTEYKTTSWRMLALQKCCGFLGPDIAQLLQLHLNHHHHHQQQRHTGKERQLWNVLTFWVCSWNCRRWSLGTFHYFWRSCLKCIPHPASWLCRDGLQRLMLKYSRMKKSLKL